MDEVAKLKKLKESSRLSLGCGFLFLIGLIFVFFARSEGPEPEIPQIAVTAVAKTDEQLTQSIRLIDRDESYGHTGRTEPNSVKLASGQIVSVEVQRSIFVTLFQTIWVSTFDESQLVIDIVVCSEPPAINDIQLSFNPLDWMTQDQVIEAERSVGYGHEN